MLQNFNSAQNSVAIFYGILKLPFRQMIVFVIGEKTTFNMLTCICTFSQAEYFRYFFGILKSILFQGNI